MLAPGATKSVAILGDLFIAGLKAVAPVLVFVLVAVTASFVFPTTLALRHASAATWTMLNDLSNAVTSIVQVVIRFAPLGIFGLVAATLGDTGLDALLGYGQLLMVIVGCMLFVALVVNPLIVLWTIRSNPYPLVFTCLRESGVTAFFTRSSAANIPINLALCKRMGLHEDTYAISIPLAAANTLGIPVDIPTALLLIPMATALFGISPDVAMQVVANG